MYITKQDPWFTDQVRTVRNESFRCEVLNVGDGKCPGNPPNTVDLYEPKTSHLNNFMPNIPFDLIFVSFESARQIL